MPWSSVFNITTHLICGKAHQTEGRSQGTKRNSRSDDRSTAMVCAQLSVCVHLARSPPRSHPMSELQGRRSTRQEVSDGHKAHWLQQRADRRFHQSDQTRAEVRTDAPLALICSLICSLSHLLALSLLSLCSLSALSLLSLALSLLSFANASILICSVNVALQYAQ